MFPALWSLFLLSELVLSASPNPMQYPRRADCHVIRGGDTPFQVSFSFSSPLESPNSITVRGIYFGLTEGADYEYHIHELAANPECKDLGNHWNPLKLPEPDPKKPPVHARSGVS